MCFYQPSKWKNYLDAAECWFNTNYHRSLQLTPFLALYGYCPPELAIYSIGTGVAIVDEEQAAVEYNAKRETAKSPKLNEKSDREKEALR